MNMKPILNQSFFIQNRAQTREKLADKLPLIVAGNGVLQRTGDNNLSFAQDSSMWYLCGINTPDVVLVLTENDEFLIVPGRSAVREAFDGATDTNALTERSGITIILDETEGWNRLAALLDAKKQASYLKPLPVYDARHGLYANPARRRLADKLRRTQHKLVLFDARHELSTLRSTKQQIEIALIEHAVNITKDTLAEVIAGTVLTDMRYEFELEAAITQGFRRRGATGHAYNPIVASGKHATTLHYGENNGPIAQSEYIVVDVGAEVEHYAADVTRTLIQGSPSSRQQAVYDAVVRLQQQALELLRPGTLLRDYESVVEKLTGAELKQLGLISDIHDRKAIRHYYPHSTSHFLGLDVHDVGDYSQPLTANMVLTCEPGIYIPEEGIGVRIEDDILITDSGNRVL